MIMYHPGNIIYFTPFYFSDGNPCKPKYFIILMVDDESNIVACMPTRSDSVPNMVPKKHGCLNDDSINFNCYFIESGKTVTENGFSFPIDTYIYGERVAVFSRKLFEEIYLIENVDYKILGKLLDSEYNNINNCFKNSRSTKRGIRRKLGAKI
jgi:hypothetical protein